MQEEVQAYLLGQADRLPAPLPFRNLVAQARLGVSQEEHEAFFRQMLGDVEEADGALRAAGGAGRRDGDQGGAAETGCGAGAASCGSRRAGWG